MHGRIERRDTQLAGVERGSRRLTLRRGMETPPTDTHTRTHKYTDTTHHAGQEVTPVLSIVPTPQAKLPRWLIHCRDGWVTTVWVWERKEWKAACDTMQYLYFSHIHTRHTIHMHTLNTAGTNGWCVHAAGISELGRRRVRDHEENFDRFCGRSVEQWHSLTTAMMYSCVHKIYTSTLKFAPPRAHLAVKECARW